LGKESKEGYFGLLTDSSQSCDLNVYKAYFYDQEHTNYLGVDPEEGAVCMSLVRVTASTINSPAVRHRKVAQRPAKKYRVLIRTKKGDNHVILAASSQKELFESLRSVYPFVDKKILTEIVNPKFAEDLLSFEDTMMYTEFKFGVLYYRDGQTNEDEMFGNVETSTEYEEFLELLGEKVRLQGWKHYAAGLDVDKNQTGLNSIYTKWNNYEIMFHVSTLLPYSKKDHQQIERKRHLGNDAVLIVFHDGQTPFNPQCITSKYNQIYVVVQAYKEGAQTMYKVAVATRDDVPEYAPRLPNPPVFAKGEKFREFILKKMINGLKSSMRSPYFAKKIYRSRALVLDDYAEKYLK